MARRAAEIGSSFSFEVTACDGAARAGRLRTPHGEVATPAFMPVATQAAVKGLGPRDLRDAGASILLSNLYHLTLRPGIDTIVELGGLHRFSGWSGPLLTDSGGYQVFSLARLASIDDDGVTFQSHLDGGTVRLTPEGVVQAQERLGVDIAMVLDECPPYPTDEQRTAAALERTLEWADRSRRAWSGGDSALFGIVQGGTFPRLRQRAVGRLSELEFPGYAIGGVSVGEPLELRRRVVEQTTPLLPPGAPRYLMGVGTPHDLLHAVHHGLDLFDCVLPTRNARHGMAFTSGGRMRLKNARYRTDPAPLDLECSCSTCATVSRALLHHLVRAGEISAAVLLTRHNLRFYLDFMGQVREAIASGSLAELVAGESTRGLQSS